jgi:hypothetical protein
LHVKTRIKQKRTTLLILIFTLHILGAVTLVWAQNWPYPLNPSWISVETNNTHAVALGDIDLDGDLDLICGNLDRGSTVYMNDGGFFAADPGFLNETEAALSVALGDVDGDGDLDLVCGNSAQSNSLYLNQGGFFTKASWSSGPDSITYGVVLADIDLDRDLDLVCVNWHQSNTVYINTNGSLSTSPDTISNVQDSTRSVAVGDIDGDGYLDLICGNHGKNTVYMNNGGAFESTPAQTFGPPVRTTGIALGDFDGDGDLDLVCSNFNQNNNVYLNQGGLFDPVPVWSYGPDSTLSVDVGDVDSDGDLDLVFANKNQVNSIYLNQGGPEIFSVAPVWSSAAANKTTAAKLGDLDGDGDLDLVCGNSDEINTVYLNEDGPFPTIPDWISATANRTLSIAVGDVDGDEDLDLVCGNQGLNTMYPNEGGMFRTTPAWHSGESNLTADVALGDIDGLLGLDVVCGNADFFGLPNTVYLNDGVEFETATGWSSQLTYPTLGTYLGDVDDDGDLDLVCGNANKPNTLYRNEGGVLSADSVWSSGPSNPTTSVVLGDVTGDGTLDLVCGNSGADNTIYYNRGGSFPASPDWSSNDGNVTGCVALGDVNGDGKLDLVCGNDGQANTVYLNTGGTLNRFSSWTNERLLKTAGIALGDLNGDGYLDVACGNLSQQNTVYMNDGGMFTSQPVWTSTLVKETEDIALGDIDNDGDLDLICGNERIGSFPDSNTVYLGEKNPAYRGDPTIPTHHIVNNGAFIPSVSIEQTEANRFRLSFNVVDVESDPVWVLAEYQFEGDPQWYPALSSGGSALTGPYNSLPAGNPVSLLWDITQVAFDDRNIVLRLKVIEVPGRVSVIQHATSYLKWIGPLEPYRPEIVTSTDVLDFAKVTVGDTTSLDLVIANNGNIDLVINSVILPSVEMRVNELTPVVIAPSTNESIRVLLEPLQEIDISGTIELFSNDPITPACSILVTTDIIALEATSRLLTSGTVLPLGDAATVIVEPLPDVHVEGGTLFHRPAGSIDFSSIRLGPSGNDFVAVIPGSAVTEVGVEYYVEIENLPIRSTDPPNAPVDPPYFWPVEKPAYITSSPRPTLNEDFLEGRSIRVQVDLPQGAGFVSGILYYREGGKRAYEQTHLILEDSQIFALIPGSLVDSRGVDYWVQVETLTDTLTDPANNAAMYPASIPVLVENLVEPEMHAGAGVEGSTMKYRIFSIPLKMRGSILGSIADELGGRDNTAWRLFAHDAGSSSYAEIPNDSLNSFEQGRAYWLITRERHKIGTGSDRGETALTDQAFEIVLQPGYNLISNPYTFAVDWDSLLVDTLSMDEAVGVLVEPPYGWVQDRGLVDEVDVLHPFDGYWVKNLSSSSVVLKIPAIESVPAPTEDLQSRQTLVAALDHWSIRIVASSGGAYDAACVAGVNPLASTGWDKMDRSKPPMVPGEMVSLYFPHAAWTEHPGCYGHDIRGKYETFDSGTLQQDAWGHVWRFDVRKNFTRETAGDEVMVTFEGIADVPQEASMYLVDNKVGSVTDLRVTDTYRFYQGKKDRAIIEDDARFSLIVGNEPFVVNGGRLPAVPSRTHLHQNYPNPFNPVTIIRYELAEASHVSIRIFDASGARVRDLFHGFRLPGVYEIGWDAKNESGHSVATGIYFCRFEAGQTIETRKMLLIK